MTYLSALSFGEFQELEKKMQNIEQNLGVIYGASTWCDRCKKCSILSYTIYVYTSKQSRSQEPLKGRLDYYAHMCDLVERLTGKTGAGFTVQAD